MSELINIFKDIKSKALPLNEIPGFVLWAIGKRIWFLLMMVLAVALFWKNNK